MINSDIRIKYISEYISAYENKIRLLNNQGLFDSAKLFELFAIEVGSLYFGQKLKNLNIEKFNYPTVDLISEDKTFYVQVSTVKNISSKIKYTLDKIKNSDDPKLKGIRRVKFFVLNNESVSKVADLKDKNQIGDIPFVKKDDLITTENIIDKAINDLDFQCKLYDLLLKEERSIRDNLSKLKDAINNSIVGLENIDSKINNEYEIDRADLIQKIKSENHKNVSIQGLAGSGKSALCKLLLKGEPNIIFARAERFLEETDVNKIWGFNIRETLAYLNDKPIAFFIDALEFIADCKTKLDLLDVLYDCAKNYLNVKIITSCRTSDRNAFIKLEGNYNIKVYELEELTKEQQADIYKHYPIIAKMAKIEGYKSFLSLPLYVNMIVNHITEVDKIEDENQFREYIWENVICKNDNKRRDLINDIVFTRTKDSAVGASIDKYDIRDINKLISEGILLKNSNTVRLKYDMFEDICFERYFDISFYKCKGNYAAFYDGIITVGYSVYRRYQIWIENKLLVKENREKFLYELVFSDTISPEWKKQTQIGLIKSRHSKPFFTEYGKDLIENNLLNDFIYLTNLYGFEMDSNSIPQYIIFLKASGNGRACLIHLIAYEKWHINNMSSWSAISKLCNDYAKCKPFDKQIALDCLNIIGYIIESHFPVTSNTNSYGLDNTLKDLISPIYAMAEYTSDWIKTFWRKLSQLYMSGENSEVSIGCDLIEHALRFEHIALAQYLPEDLCKLAELFWVHTPKMKDERLKWLLRQNEEELTYLYGLSQQAENYEHGSTNESVIFKSFFLVLFRTNFWLGAQWAIRFVNNAVEKLSKNTEGGLPKYTIYFTDGAKSKDYMGFAKMWLATTQEHSMPLLLSDLIYCLKYEIRNKIKTLKDNNSDYVKFANEIKDILYTKSNNIALLTIISDVGMEFENDLPGYALDLISNIYIVLNDLSRYATTIKDPTKELLEKQIIMSIGIPFPLENRYRDFLPKINLIDYFIKTFLCGNDIIKGKCSAILDYLYSIIPNDEDHAKEYLHIQKMDIRKSKLSIADDKYIVITAVVTGAAEKLTQEQEKINRPYRAVDGLIEECNKKLQENKFTLDDCNSAIGNLIIEMKKSSQAVLFENNLIALICYALSDSSLDSARRDEYCNIWMDGIYRIIDMKSFVFEPKMAGILFAQIEMRVSEGVKNKIKRLMLDCILYNGQNGIIFDLRRQVHNYLLQNESLSIAFFNTIVKLSEDEMSHQKYNACYAVSHKIYKDAISFVPNMSPKLVGVDNYIKENGDTPYADKKEEIIQEYLYNEQPLDLSSFAMSEHDISIMSYALNCIFAINDSNRQIVKSYIIELIAMFNSTVHTYNGHQIVNFYQSLETQTLLQRELLMGDEHTDAVLSILFDNIDFFKFNKDAVEYYREVLGELLSFYFDSHKNREARIKCENIIYKLEEKINNIKNESVREQLYKSLIFALTKGGGAGDWSKFSASYSYRDKQFLNKMFSKYGGYHLAELIDVIFKLHVNELLPEILISIRDACQNCIKYFGDEIFGGIIRAKSSAVLLLITIAFLDFNGKIKEDEKITDSYIWMLEKLCDMGYSEAAVILDEFRIH